MTSDTCPYCRESISQWDRVDCPCCKTPHHSDCWKENEGCTVFGCEKAPLEEPKVAISSLAAAGSASSVPTIPVESDLAALRRVLTEPPPLPPTVETDPCPGVPRFGRLPYIGSVIGIFIGGTVLMGLVTFTNIKEMPSAVLLLMSVGWCVAIFLRTRDVGLKGIYSVLATLPLANIWLGYHLLLAPRGYAITKKADLGMKIGVGVFIGLFLLLILAAVLASFAKA